MEIAGLFLGVLLSFVLNTASRNSREGLPHPRMLLHAGHLLLGVTSGLAVLLSAWAGFLLIA